LTSLLEHAGCWFLYSGIQESNGAEFNGGVARYFRADSGQNAPVSNEITGYAASAFAYLYSLSGRREYLDACARAARYLCDQGWDPPTGTFPFEPGSRHAYFFDTGIIARGLMAAWRATGDESFAIRAREAARSLSLDFSADSKSRGAFPPVIMLPDKIPLDYQPRWSRSPGCYQLKSALAWLETSDPDARRCFDSALEYSLATHESFLAEESDREKLMDRLHAYCYFLEALLFVAGRDQARDALNTGVDRVGALLREIASDFERSDVCAQLLRLRLIVHHLEFAPLDEVAAGEEADRTAAYQAFGSSGVADARDVIDTRLRGGFWFGRKRGEVLPYMNPVSTAFSMQALALWEQHRTGAWRFELHQLI
jgi:hypothetical protein